MSKLSVKIWAGVKIWASVFTFFCKNSGQVSKLLVSVKIWAGATIFCLSMNAPIPGPWVGLLEVLLEGLQEDLLAVPWVAHYLW